jgi:hypothetical protein
MIPARPTGSIILALTGNQRGESGRVRPGLSMVRINPDAAIANTYAAISGFFPRLVAGLHPVASLFAGDPPSLPSANVCNR